MQRSFRGKWIGLLALLGIVALFASLPGVQGQQTKKKKEKTKAKAKVEITFPPQIPGGKEMVTDRSEDFLKPTETLKPGVAIAKTPPTVDFLYYPGQTYEGKPWSNWGDSLAVGGKYYASIGDHLAPAGNGFIFEYDPAKKKLRQLLDLKKVLNMPAGHYVPGKIHSRLDMGEDGWIYYSTHRGSPRVTNDMYHYKGDWILRTNPETAKTEVVVHGPVPRHCIPCSVLDPKRLIFYGGTAPGEGDASDIQFFAYDVKNKKLLYSGPNGPARYMVFAKSTGRVYFNPSKGDTSLVRYDPEKGGPPVKIPGNMGIRAASQETPQGFVYSVSNGQRNGVTLYSMNTKTEEIKNLGQAEVGSQTYIATLDADPTGKYLYYCAGAHGGSDKDGCAVVQYNVQTNQKKVIAFLHPFYEKKYGCTLKGTYSIAVDSSGDKLYITWNASRGSRAWDCCALTVIHIPESER